MIQVDALDPDDQLVYELLKSALQAGLELNPDNLLLDFDLYHQIWEIDSLDMAELSAVIEAHLGVWVRPDSLRSVRTMLDLVKLVTPTFVSARSTP